MRCVECGGKMTTQKAKSYRYTESGLSNVFLSGIAVHQCRSCGVKYPEIPRIQDLHLGIAKLLAFKDGPLAGEEIRFLRKEMGLKAKDLANQMGVTKQHFSKWENNEEPIGAGTDRLLRCLFLLDLIKRKELKEFVNPIRELSEIFSELSSPKGTLPKPQKIELGPEMVLA